LQALRKLNKQQTAPRTDIYLTLTTHAPHEYPRSSHFQDIVKNKIAQTSSLSEKEKDFIYNRLDIYGSYTYSDWAIQQLIEGYKNRNDFENAIFIITGDHHPYPQQFGGYYNYHVPLIIYSPMLNSNRIMKGVVSHRDVTPTLLSLLKNKFNIETPHETAWLNTALDTSLTFNANTFSPLQLIDHTLEGILYKNYMLCEGVLEEFTNDGIHKINNPDILQQLNRMLYLYQSIERYILYNNALLRNDDTQKHKQENVVIDIEDSVERESYFAKTSMLPIVEGPEGHKTTLYFDSDNLYPMRFLRFRVPNNEIEKFMVEIEFKVYIKSDVQNKNLKLIFDLKENDKSAKYHAEYLGDEKHNRWYTCKRMLIYQKELFASAENDYLLSVYLWNEHEVEAYIDDIKVKVITD
jgi:hypothetical protein